MLHSESAVPVSGEFIALLHPEKMSLLFVYLFDSTICQIFFHFYNCGFTWKLFWWEWDSKVALAKFATHPWQICTLPIVIQPFKVHPKSICSTFLLWVLRKKMTSQGTNTCSCYASQLLKQWNLILKLRYLLMMFARKKKCMILDSKTETYSFGLLIYLKKIIKCVLFLP